MKKLWLFLILWIALLISPTFAQYSTCEDCLENNWDYLSCVGGWAWDENESSCTFEYNNNDFQCFEQYDTALCPEEDDWCFEEMESLLESCQNQVIFEYNSCVSYCQSAYCSSSCTTQWWWSEWWSEWWVISSTWVITSTQER